MTHSQIGGGPGLDQAERLHLAGVESGVLDTEQRTLPAHMSHVSCLQPGYFRLEQLAALVAHHLTSSRVEFQAIGSKFK